MRIRIPRITDNEAIEAFITGLRYHNDLRDKLLHKWPITVVDLLTTAKKYAHADDAKKLLNKGTDKAPYSPWRNDYRDNHHRDDFRGRSDIRDRCNDNRDRRDNRNQHGHRRDNFKRKRARDDDGEVNAVKKFGGVTIMKKTMLKP
jgi:outer membrane receptor protein involved in Fe transport